MGRCSLCYMLRRFWLQNAELHIGTQNTRVTNMQCEKDENIIILIAFQIDFRFATSIENQCIYLDFLYVSLWVMGYGLTHTQYV